MCAFGFGRGLGVDLGSGAMWVSLKCRNIQETRELSKVRVTEFAHSADHAGERRGHREEDMHGAGGGSDEVEGEPNDQSCSSI